MSFIIMRFTSGEQVMATLDAENHTHIQVAFPMVIKTIPVLSDGRMHEHVMAQPFCQFTEDKYFDIPKSSLVFIKKLNQTLVPHYLKLVEAYEDTVLTKPKSGLHWGDEQEEMTVEDFKNRLDELEDIFSVDSETDSKPSNESIEVDGNDTIH